MRLPSDERMSTLLTPAGLAIEGGVQGAVTTRYGYPFKSPVDQFLSIPVAQAAPGDTPATRVARFSVDAPLPAALPPGLYRLRFDFGVMVGHAGSTTSTATPSPRGRSRPEAGTITYFYSPIIPASGTHVSGRVVHGGAVQPRIPWLLLLELQLQRLPRRRGRRGPRPLRHLRSQPHPGRRDPADVRRQRERGSRTRSSPSSRPTPSTRPRTSPGTGPAGNCRCRSPAPTAAAWTSARRGSSRNRATARRRRRRRFTCVEAAGLRPLHRDGQRVDRRHDRAAATRAAAPTASGSRKRMTLATATFQGMPYPVGSSYGRDIQFNPAVPADVQVTATSVRQLRRERRPDADLHRQGLPGRHLRGGAGHEIVPARRPGRVPRARPGHLHRRGGTPLGLHDAPRGRRLPRSRRPSSRAARSSPIGGKYVDRGETHVRGVHRGRRHTAPRPHHLPLQRRATCCSSPPRARAPTRSSRS